MLVSAKAAADIQMLMEQAGQTNRLGRAPPRQEPIRVLARLDWHEVKKVAHYWLEVDAFAQPMRVREDSLPYRLGGRETSKCNSYHNEMCFR